MMIFLDCTLLYNRGSTNFDKNLVYFFWKKCEDDIENWTSTIGKFIYIYIYRESFYGKLKKLSKQWITFSFFHKKFPKMVY